MTCEDCYNKKICAKHGCIKIMFDESTFSLIDDVENRCEDFKDKNKIFESPIAIGDPIYRVSNSCSAENPDKDAEIDERISKVCESYQDCDCCPYNKVSITEEKASLFEISSLLENWTPKYYITKEEAEKAKHIRELEISLSRKRWVEDNENEKIRNKIKTLQKELEEMTARHDL